MENITCEPLGEGRSILVSRTHRFGTDAFLLAEFASPRRRERAADLGTGCGIIPTLWLGKNAVESVLGVELSEEACALAAETARRNGDDGRFEILCRDMRRLKGAAEQERYDLVVCNPPYFVPGSGYVSPHPERAQARSELECSIRDVLAAARYLLRYGGRFCMCHRPERLADVICAMREYGIEPKRMRMVQQSAEKPPWLTLIEGRRGGAPALEHMPPLLMLDGEGRSSEEIERMYGSYREGRGSK